MVTWGGIARLLRRRVVLGLIFGLSLTYCAISLFAHEKIGSSIENYEDDRNDDKVMIDNDDLVGDQDPEDEIRGKHIPWPLPSASNDGGLGSTNNDSNVNVVERNCRNSIQGKALIVDERGLVCARKEVLPGGCCREDVGKTDRYSCATCNPEGCCAVYEYCVSCCLHPGKRRSKKDAQSVSARREGEKSRRTEEAVKLRFRNLDRFQICLAICRTSSASVRHENTYKDPNSKHCYVNSSGHQRVQRDLISINNNGDNVAITFSTIRPNSLHKGRLKLSAILVMNSSANISIEYYMEYLIPIVAWIVLLFPNAIIKSKFPDVTYGSTLFLYSALHAPYEYSAILEFKIFCHIDVSSLHWNSHYPGSAMRTLLIYARQYLHWSLGR